MIKNLLCALLILISGGYLHAGVTVADKNYEYNLITSKWDLYPSSGFFAAVAAATSTIPSGSTNYILNYGTGAAQIFNVSSGTAINFNASTITTQNLIVADQVILATVTAHTFRGVEIFVSTINGASPLNVQGINRLNFGDGSNQYTAAIITSTANIIVNTDVYEPKQVNIASATVSELSVTTGAIKMVAAPIEMNGNIHYLSKDKQSYFYFDEVNRWMRYYLEGLEAYRIEK
jgi:hypothetical protein